MPEEFPPKCIQLDWTFSLRPARAARCMEVSFSMFSVSWSFRCFQRRLLLRIVSINGDRVLSRLG